MAVASSQWIAHCNKIDTPAQNAIRQLQANTAGRQCGTMPFSTCLAPTHCSISEFPCWKTFYKNRWSQFTSFGQRLICAVVTAGEATMASKLQALFKQRYAVR